MKPKSADPPAVSEASVQGRWQVVIPMHLTSLNRLLRMHWTRRDRTLKAEADAIAIFCNLASVPRAEGKRRITQRITLVRNDRRRDSDNGFKSLLDGLVKCGRLVNDGPDDVVTMPIEHDRGLERKTTIIIEDLS